MRCFSKPTKTSVKLAVLGHAALKTGGKMLIYDM